MVRSNWAYGWLKAEWLKAIACTLTSLISSDYCLAAETTPRTVGGLELRVDASLEIEPVTTPELIKWPIVADWDAQGRLVVAECGGVDKPIAEHNKQLLHRIIRLVDTDGDGKFDKRIVAADKLAFPEGVLCVGNSMLVSAPPEIWKLTDADGDGVCEHREVWFNPGTLTGCANDLHGPYMGRDGWVYWCKGAFAEQKHELISGKQLTTKAAHIFRRRFEGGAIEPVMTGGMDNPVELAISHAGERFFTSTFLQQPSDGLRDGIAHAIYGGVYGKQNDVIDGHVRTGPLMPIMTQLGPAAPSGLICLESDRLLGAARAGVDTLVATQFNLHKVTAHDLVPNGAGFVTHNRDLITSERIDFHPTDVIEAADGSLLVIDTGGWYNLCCPSSHIDQSIAAGGIYRLTSATNRQVAAMPPADWNALSFGQAVSIVHDNKLSLRQRQQALWRIGRLMTSQDKAGAQSVLTESLREKLPELRQVAAHCLSVERVTEARTALETALRSEEDPAAARAMAEALGRVGATSSMDVLLSKFSMASGDRMLEHSMLYALIELDQPERLQAQLKSADPQFVRAALVAIDQSGRSDLLDPRLVVAALQSKSLELRQSAAEILARKSEWASKATHELAVVWEKSEKDASFRTVLGSVIAAWINAPEVVATIAGRVDGLAELSGTRDTGASLDALLDVLGSVRNQPLPISWTKGLLALLSHSDQEHMTRLAGWLSNMKIDESQSALVATSIQQLLASTKDEAVQLKLMAALRAGTKLASADTEAFVIEHFIGAYGTETVHAAAQALARLQVSEASALALIDSLDKVQPLELMQALSSISGVGQDALDEKLLTKLVALPAARTLAFDQLTTLYRNRSDELKAQVRQAVETLGKPPADVEAKLDELLGKMKSGDATRGFQVFRSTKSACSACHRIGYVGGRVGPELTRIGTTRSRRALLEAIVFPNARLEQSYAPVRVLTVDGQVFNGLVASEAGGKLELITGANQRVTIAISDIEKRVTSQVSIMPAGLDQQLTLDELADLLTLLEAAGR